jgi:uncharacterized protein (UPF0333 family)
MSKMRVARGQSVIEYMMLILIITTAIIAMTIYLYRSSNARIKRSQQELNYYNVD